ncbi:MAG: hypothetical protein D6690_15990 [Nitrospirae bacterium]|nr:MAG: hypothetical protein D6690_15990 [Nitrospirota bacterium]
MPIPVIGPVPTPRGHPIPVCRRQSPKHWRGELVSRRALLVGDAGGLVDPLLGEGIYYAVRSGRLAADAILAMWRDSARRLEEYEEMAIREFGTEFRIAARLSRFVYGLPRSWHRWAGSRYPNAYRRVLERYCQVLQGEETYRSLWLHMVRKLARPFPPRTNA